MSFVPWPQVQRLAGLGHSTHSPPGPEEDTGLPVAPVPYLHLLSSLLWTTGVPGIGAGGQKNQSDDEYPGPGRPTQAGGGSSLCTSLIFLRVLLSDIPWVCPFKL